MSGLDLSAYNRGRNYRLISKSGKLAALYVHTLHELADTLNLYRNDSFFIVDLRDLKRLEELVNRRARAVTHALNGDKHPDLFGVTKADYAERWQQEADNFCERIDDLAHRCGYTGVVYNGIWAEFMESVSEE
jgi:hypothetical protein